MESKKEKEYPWDLSKEEQTLLVLQGKCPHNVGWTYEGHGHNDEAYRCIGCGYIMWW